MPEQSTCPDPQSESAYPPSHPEKYSSFSKGLENIILIGAGITFIASLLSRDKKAEKDSNQIESSKEKNDIEPTQDKRKFHFINSWTKNLRISKKVIIQVSILILIFLVFLLIARCWGRITEIIFLVFIYFSTENAPLGIALLATLIAAFFMFLIKRTVTIVQTNLISLTNKYFIATLAGLAILGASSALLVPSYTNLFREPGYTSPQQDNTRDNPEKVQETPTSTPSSTSNKAAEVEQKSTSDLRLHLLYITGGIIAILGLIETNRKNSQDHIRQVHSARRDRYIKAVDKLSSEHAPVRLGGVYALAGLVDEWLGDDDIEEKTRFKEGQIIINNLCSYIRSPFPAAEKIEEYESRNELKKLKSEKPKNLSEEESLRLKVLNERFKNSGAYNSPENISSVYTELHEEQDVRQAIFVEMNKRGSTFTTDENGELNVVPGPWSDFDYDFSHALIFYSLNNITIEKGNFSGAKFFNSIDFSQVFFPTKADFNKTTFYNEAVFQAATFNEAAEFNGVTFNDETHFVGVTFNDEALFYTTGFNNNAYFSGADFNKGAYFYTTTFTGKATFYKATFKNQVDFGTVTFNEEANFVGVIFTGQADFSDTTFVNKSPSFALIIEELDIVFRAQFAILPEGESGHDFTVSEGSRPIPVKRVNLDDVKRYIPIGAVLFDPDSGRKSKPAK